MQKIPNLFIVGFPKSGTTSLHLYLDQHPEIFMSKIKEPWYFAKDFYDESISFHSKPSKKFRFHNDENYLELFKKATEEKIIGESSANYIFSKVSAKEIKKFNSEAKIIIIIREPVSFLYSLHWQHLSSAVDEITDFKKVFELEEDRKLGHSIPKSVEFPSQLFYSDKIKYYDHISRFLKYFDTDNIKIILFEDFIKNIELIYKEVLEWIQVDPSFIANFEVYNSFDTPRSYWLNRWIRNTYLIRFFEKHISYNNFSYFVSLSKKFLLKNTKKVPIDNKFKISLMKKIKPEVIKASDLLHIDLVSKWGYDKI